MFKSGEIVRVKADGRRATVLAEPTAATPSRKWPIATSEGVFDETELAPAHPSVVATAESRDLATEAWKADIDTRAKSAGRGLPFETRQMLEKALSGASLDFNGHWKGGSILQEDHKTLKDVHMLFLRDTLTKVDADDILEASKTQKPMDRWVPVDVGLRMTGLRTCSYCGEDEFTTETNGVSVRIAGKPCEFPDGLPLTEWELNVPSGKLVVANDLRELFPLDDDDFDINTTMGCRQTALAYAANGMSHAFVGNSCPGVYKLGDGLFKIANPPSADMWNGKDWVKVKPAPKFEGKRVTSICTDLWWYSACDHAEFKRRCKRFEQKAEDFSVSVISVRPGVYRFRHDEEARRHESGTECIFAHFEWVREADPVKDLLSTYEETDVNAHAYVQAQVGRWPTLYGKIKDRLGGREKDNVVPWSDMTEEDRLSSWRSVANHVLCTIGGGVEWHEKGFPRVRVDSSIPDVEPPSFREQNHWYPFSKPYGGLFEPKTLAPSFAKLAFRVLESVISFGTAVQDGNHSREVRYVRERMLVAVKRYRELAKQYPDKADPEYVAWLSQKGRAEAWVKSFELGEEFTEKHRKHAAAQRWVPADAYAVVFDARKLKDGHFAWHPKNGGCWASKKDAQRYAVLAWEDNGQPAENNCFWSSHASNTSIPLYSVARVTKLGEVSHMGETLVEIAFDYGTPWMRNAAKRKALSEATEKAGIKVLSREEYEKLLPEAVSFFETAEATTKKTED